MKFFIYQDSKGEWRWRLKTKNGRVIADSGEGYARKDGAVRAAKILNSMPMAEFEMEDGE